MFSLIEEVALKNASSLNLTTAVLTNVTNFYVPNIVGVLDGVLKNSDKVITLCRITEPTDVVDFSNVPNMEEVVKRSGRGWTKAGYRSRHSSDALKNFGSKAKVSGAIAHSNHCLNTTHDTSFIRALLAKRLITNAQASALQKYAKKFQHDWVALVEDRIIDAVKATFPKTAAQLKKACGSCKSKKKKLMACGGCKSVYYCSVKCQHDVWEKHKVECKRVKKKNKRTMKTKDFGKVEIEAGEMLSAMMRGGGLKGGVLWEVLKWTV